MKTKVVVGVGIPGSGKTTCLKPMAEREGLLYLNADDIRLELTGSATNHTQERRVWSLLHRRLVKALSSGRGVLVDATYANAGNRRRFVKLVRGEGADEVLSLWFNLPLEVCLKRNSERDRSVPEDVILSMYESLRKSPPDILEGFDAVVEILE